MTIPRHHDGRAARPSLQSIALGGVLLLLAAVPCGAQEEPSDDAPEEQTRPIFDFSAYGTLGFVHSDEDRADYLGGLFIENGAGFSADWSPEVDSRIGAQLTATFTPRLSAVVQVIAEQGPEGSYEPHVEWANVKYQMTPDFSVRVGRKVISSFLLSDSRKVGYANPWVRPPVEVYAMVPVTSSDGVDVSYRRYTGTVSHTVLANYGQTDKELGGGTEVQARDARSLTWTSERGPLTLRAHISTTRLKINSFNTLFDGFRQFGPPGVAIAERYDVDGSSYQFLGVGALYDPGSWFVMTEWGTADSDTVLGGRTAWYVSAGVRRGTLTPYATYSTTAPDSARSDPGLAVDAYPPQLSGVIQGLNGALNGILAGNPLQDTMSAGLRWDFHAHFALKLQVDHSNLGADSAGSLGNPQVGFRPGGSYNLISMAVDFVF